MLLCGEKVRRTIVFHDEIRVYSLCSKETMRIFAAFLLNNTHIYIIEQFKFDQDEDNINDDNSNDDNSDEAFA